MIFDIIDIEEKIKYTFKNKQLLMQAFTHSSFANENNCQSNERLEFLGDAVLQFIVTEILFKKYPNTNEGAMSKQRAGVVCATSLYDTITAIKIAQHIKFGQGQKNGRGDMYENIFCDLYEALLGAIYLDGGIAQAKQFVESTLINKIANFTVKTENKDSKTRLQECVQQGGKGNKIEYILVEKSGLEHEPLFTYKLEINGVEYARATGRNIKNAQQLCASDALAKFSRTKK